MSKTKRRGPSIHRERGSAVGFQFATSLLNNTFLDHSASISSWLSGWDVFLPFDSELGSKAQLNYPHLRLFAAALLASSACETGTKRIQDEDVSRILNNCRDATYDPVAGAALRAQAGLPGNQVELQRFLSRIMHAQFQATAVDPALLIGRAAFFFDALMKVAGSKLSENQVARASEMLPRIFTHLGASVAQLGRVFLCVVILARDRQETMAHEVERELRIQSKGQPTVHAVIRAACELSLDPTLASLSPIDLIHKGRGMISASDVAAFLRIFAAGIDRQRQVATAGPFAAGHHSTRLIALERYPVLGLSTSGQFMVPNLAIFLKSFFEVLDFYLLESFQGEGPTEKDRYEAYRGDCMEAFAAWVLEDILALPSFRERAYGAPELRGADLTVIEPEAQRLILVEVKAKRMLAQTIASMSTEDLLADLDGPTQAISKGKAKARNLRARLPEFADVQNLIDGTDERNGVFIVVSSNLALGTPELIAQMAALDPQHLLHQFGVPFCFMSLASFERASAIAKLHGRPLGEVLRAFADRAATWSLVDPLAEMFDPGDAVSREQFPSWSVFESELGGEGVALVRDLWG